MMTRRSTPPLGPLAALSIIVGLLLLWPVGWLFDVLHLPVLHSWGIAHGGYVLAWPLASAAFFLVAWAFVAWRGRTERNDRSQV